MMSTVFWEVTPCGLVNIYRFFYLELYNAYHRTNRYSDGLLAGGRGYIPGGGKIFTILHSVHTGFGTYQASYPVVSQQ
jgi:hypothetical protein